MKVLIKQFKENGLVPETTVRTQRLADFLNMKNRSFLVFQQKRGPNKKFWKPEILEVAESDIFCVKSGADHDTVIGNWPQPLFVELEAHPCPKNELQNALKIPVISALYGKPLRPNVDCVVAETHLE